MLPIWSEPEWLDLLLLVSIPIMPVILGYVLLRKGRSAWMRATGGIVVGFISGLVGTFGLVAYAIPSLDDFHNPAVDGATAFVGSLIVWSVCVGALIIFSVGLRQSAHTRTI